MGDAFIVRRGGGEDVTAEVNEQTPLIQEIMEALVGKVQGANATADKIIAPYKAYVGQQLITGTFVPEAGIADMMMEKFGYTKKAIDKFTYSTEKNLPTSSPGLALSHSLGSVPKAFVLTANKIGDLTATGVSRALIQAVHGGADSIASNTNSSSCSEMSYTPGQSAGYKLIGSSGGLKTYKPTANNIYLYRNSSMIAAEIVLMAGVEYTLITLGVIDTDPNKINFTIDGTAYQAEPNTTWETWVIKNGSTAGLKIIGENIKDASGSFYLCKSENGSISRCTTTDLITNSTYVLK